MLLLVLRVPYQMSLKHYLQEILIGSSSLKKSKRHLFTARFIAIYLYGRGVYGSSFQLVFILQSIYTLSLLFIFKLFLNYRHCKIFFLFKIFSGAITADDISH